MINLFIIVYDFSGARTYIDELSSYLVGKKNVFVFHVYLNHNGSKEFNIKEKSKITSIYIPKKVTKEYDKKYYMIAAQLIYNKFQNLHSVVLHTNIPEQFYFAEEMKKLFHCPLVFTLHFLMGFFSYYDKISGYNGENIEKGNILEKYMLETADHIICVTQFSQRAIINLHEVNPAKTSVIYNGKSLINESSPLKNKLKIQYGFLPEDRLLLFAGQLISGKGLDKLIKAFHLIKDTYPTTKLIIAGSGEYNDYLPLAQEYIGRVCFTGKLDKKILFDFYLLSEIGIIPSQFEQCSYVAIEMMQHGLPIIISDIPGLNELLIDRKTGLVCKTKSHSTIPCTLEVDEVDLALQIEYLLKNREIGLILAKAAHKRAEELYSLESMGESTLKIYRQLINTKQIEI